VHDFFNVLGLPSDAPVSEIRRAYARRGRRSHPDFREPAASRGSGVRTSDLRSSAVDAAIDFVDVTGLLDRIQKSFFGNHI
jgi:hypothetical protein